MRGRSHPEQDLGAQTAGAITVAEARRAQQRRLAPEQSCDSSAGEDETDREPDPGEAAREGVSPQRDRGASRREDGEEAERCERTLASARAAVRLGPVSERPPSCRAR